MAKECKHKFQVDGENVGTCSKCGEVRRYPWDNTSEMVVLKKGDPSISRVSKKEEHMHHKHHQIQERHSYYEANKEAMIADLISQGRSATRKKWNITSSTLCSLEKRWLTEEQRSTISPSNLGRPKQQLHLSISPASSNGLLPQLPEFSNTWEASVQVAWLQAYMKLLDRQEVEHG